MTTRRQFVLTGLAATASAVTAAKLYAPRYSISYRKKRSTVAVLDIPTYGPSLEEQLLNGLREFSLDVRAKKVLLKPNLVEALPGPVNTHSALVGAAARCFLRLGAASVTVGEGPGHQSDTELVLASASLPEQLSDKRIRFVDLNRDELRQVKLKASYTGLSSFWLPASVLDADVIVSMPKIKTHHWAGVTLSLKNMFGVVPGQKYGWPKNFLHWHGINESILDICATVPVNFVIADGIVAMEGNGPLQGTPRNFRKVVLADDPVAADATCARLMGFDPAKIEHIANASRFLGNMDVDHIQQLSSLKKPSKAFAVIPQFEHILAW
jgi:uncharacterized protein (DUF362 family)